MNIEINDPMIPGTVLRRKDMGDVTGMEFLNKIFYITDGIMLTQIRDISGIDGTTLQNWTKRGWVANSKLKRYNKDQLEPGRRNEGESCKGYRLIHRLVLQLAFRGDCS